MTSENLNVGCDEAADAHRCAEGRGGLGWTGCWCGPVPLAATRGTSVSPKSCRSSLKLETVRLGFVRFRWSRATKAILRGVSCLNKRTELHGFLGVFEKMTNHVDVHTASAVSICLRRVVRLELRGDIFIVFAEQKSLRPINVSLPDACAVGLKFSRVSSLAQEA